MPLEVLTCHMVQVWMSHYPSRSENSKDESLDLLAGPKTAFSWLPGGRPAVHRGFLNSWRANGLNQRVKKRIRDIVYSGEVDRSSVKVLCTGMTLLCCPLRRLAQARVVYNKVLALSRDGVEQCIWCKILGPQRIGCWVV